MDIINAIRGLLEYGGGILWLILLVSISLWALICERLIFFKFSYPKLQKKYQEEWLKGHCSDPRIASYMKRCILSEVQISLQQFESTIKLLIAICPMLGLLGTVIGMIQVFDVMAVAGNGNVRAMAAGISQATITTMAGMVVAISGLYFHKIIEKTILEKSHQLAVLLS